MSNKPRSNQISVNTTSFSKNLSATEDNVQKCFDIIDQLSTSASHNSLSGIEGGSLADGYYHFTGPQHTWLLDGYTNNWSVSKGGTGITTYASGDIIYASATNTLSKLAKSTDGYYLQLLSGLPSWQPVDTAGSISVDTTNFGVILSSADSTIQLVLDTLDDHVHVLNNDLSGYTNDAYVVGIRDTSITTVNNWIEDGAFNYYGGAIRCVGLAGDLYGGITTAEVRGLYGRAISSNVPEDGYALIYNQGTGEWVPGVVSTDPPDLTLGGDLSGVLGDAYVVGFNGYPLETTQVPTDGQVFFYNAIQSKWWCSQIGGDVNGSFESVTVDKIKNIEVDSSILSDGYALLYNLVQNKWIPGVVSTDPPDLTLGNDLSGSLSDAYVVGFNGYPLETTQVPTDGQVFFYNAVQSKWWCSQIGGDVSGSFESVTVDKIKNVEIDSSVLSDGYALLYNQGSNKWIPGSVTIPSVTFGGDLSGILGDAYVVGIKGKTVDDIDAWDTNGIFNYSSGDVKVTAAGGDISGAIDNISVVGMNGIELDTTAPLDGYAYIYSSSLTKWVPTKVNNSSIITVGKQDLLTANATNYLLPNFAESTDEAPIAFLVPVVGTINKLVAYCGTAPGGSESVVITVRKNSVDTAITLTITGAGTTGSDLINSISVASADKITIKSVTTLGCAASNLFVSLVYGS